MKENIWKDGMLGLLIGNALGLPVLKLSKESIINRENGRVLGMESGGEYDMPKGVWSDEGSLAIATLISVIEKKEIDLQNVMSHYIHWMFRGAYTPYGKAFCVGQCCQTAINNYSRDRDITTCGCTEKSADSNGALARILPACIFLYEKQCNDNLSDKETIDQVHKLCTLTHNYPEYQMCCSLYYFLIKSMIGGTRYSLSKQKDFPSLLQSFCGL